MWAASATNSAAGNLANHRENRGRRVNAAARRPENAETAKLTNVPPAVKMARSRPSMSIEFPPQ